MDSRFAGFNIFVTLTHSLTHSTPLKTEKRMKEASFGRRSQYACEVSFMGLRDRFYMHAQVRAHDI